MIKNPLTHEIFLRKFSDVKRSLNRLRENKIRNELYLMKLVLM